MPTKLTPVEEQERKEFALQRLKRGFSFLETQRQFAKAYSCTSVTARTWVNKACDEISAEDDPVARRRTFNVIIEMFHDQIVSYQNDILAMQKEIDAIAETQSRRKAILERMLVCTPSEGKALSIELESAPDPGPLAKGNLIEGKSRMRERMFRVMTDLARLRGFNGVSSDWRQALNILLDNNLIPSKIADGILSVLDDFEGRIRTMGDEEPQEEALGEND